jgi:hypothetical protein
MHECPECGQACDCDGDDLWQDAPAMCRCACDDLDAADDDDDDDDDAPDDGMYTGADGSAFRCRWCGEPLSLGRCADCDFGYDIPQRAR